MICLVYFYCDIINQFGVFVLGSEPKVTYSFRVSVTTNEIQTKNLKAGYLW